MKVIIPLSAALLLFVTACAPTGRTTAGSPAPAGPTAEAASATPSPVPTDAAGHPVVRPSCAEPTEGRYLHASGPTMIASVLILGSGKRGVVVGAQANGGICQTLAFGRRLAARGYHVALFEWNAPYDEAMTTAAKALLADGATRLVLGGFSRGAIVALGVAPALKRVVAGAFSVSGGPSADEGFATIASLARYPGPLLLVCAVDDPIFPRGTSEAIAKAHSGPEKVLIVPGSLHALALLDGDDGPRVLSAVDRFLTSTLGQ